MLFLLIFEYMHLQYCDEPNGVQFAYKFDPDEGKFPMEEISRITRLSMEKLQELGKVNGLL